MKANLGKLALTGFVTAALSVPALQAADLPDQSLSDYKIGETLRGDEVNADELKGRVVVIEYWGTR